MTGRTSRKPRSELAVRPVIWDTAFAAPPSAAHPAVREETMTEAWIIDACRTPRGIGKVGKGALSNIHPQQLARPS